jgi:hypothetical protein
MVSRRRSVLRYTYSALLVFTFRNSAFCLQTSFMYFVWTSVQQERQGTYNLTWKCFCLAIVVVEEQRSLYVFIAVWLEYDSVSLGNQVPRFQKKTLLSSSKVNKSWKNSGFTASDDEVSTFLRNFAIRSPRDAEWHPRRTEYSVSHYASYHFSTVDT